MDPEQYARQLRKPEGADALATTARMELLNSRFYACASRHVPKQGALTLLEIGPGNGAHAVPWLEANPALHYRALDYSRDVLAICAAGLHPWEAQTAFIHGDARNPACYAPLACDLILSVNTLYFIDDLQGLFRLWWQTLKPGGKLLLGFRPAEIMRQFPFSAHGFILHEARDVRVALQAAGFIPEEEMEFEDAPREIAGREVPVRGCCWIYRR